MNINKIMYVLTALITMHIHAVRVKPIATKNDAMMSITSANTSVFAQDNLLISVGLPPRTGDLTSNPYQEKEQLWTSLLTEMEQYLKKNDSTLLPDFKTVKQLSELLFNLMTSVYIQDIAPALQDQKDKIKGISSLDPEKINLLKINMLAIEPKIQFFKEMIEFRDNQSPKDSLILTQLIKKLEATLKHYRESRITSRRKGDAVEALIFFARYVENGAVKFINDFKKLQQAYLAYQPQLPSNDIRTTDEMSKETGSHTQSLPAPGTPEALDAQADQLEEVQNDLISQNDPNTGNQIRTLMSEIRALRTRAKQLRIDAQ